MFMCEECNYIWEEQQRYIGDPETTHCPKCGSAEIEETKPQNLAKPNAHSVLDDVLAILSNDYKTLVKNNMDHKAAGIHRATILIKEYRRKHFV